MPPVDLPHNAFAPALTAWLLTYALHSTVLLGAAWLATRLLRPSPARRDLLWKAAMIGGIVTATWQAAVPGGTLLAGHAFVPGQAAVTAGPPAYRVVEDGVVVHPEASPADPARPASGEREPGCRTQSCSSSPVAAPAGAAGLGDRLHLDRWAAGAALLWLAGALIGLGRLVAAKRRLARLLASREAVAGGPLPALLHRLRVSSGFLDPVRLSVSDHICGPVALGRREICLPRRALTDLTPNQQESVLAHELGHLVRRDPLWLVAGATVEAVFFFQPLNRAARRELRDAAEFLCDDWAVARTGRGLTLARCLAEVAGWIHASRRPLLAAGMAEERSPLVRRIERLVNAPGGADEIPGSGWLRAGAWGLCALVALAVPGVRAGVRPPEAPEPAEVAPVHLAVFLGEDGTAAPLGPAAVAPVFMLPPARPADEPAPPAPLPFVVLDDAHSRIRFRVAPRPDAPLPPALQDLNLRLDLEIAPLLEALDGNLSPADRARLEALARRISRQFEPQVRVLERQMNLQLQVQMDQLRDQLGTLREQDVRRLIDVQAAREARERARERRKAARDAARDGARSWI